MFAVQRSTGCAALAAALVVTGCGAGVAGRASAPGDPAAQTAAAASALADAANRQDAAAIAAQLAAPLAYGGLVFSDPACAAQFGAPAQLDAAALPAFAGCLAGLALKPSTRRDPRPSVAILEYPPGIEVAARFGAKGDRLALRAIGPAADTGTGTVTLSAVGLAALRTDTSESALPPAALEQLDAERTLTGSERAYAWLEVCLDAAGAPRAVRPLEASSPAAVDAFTAVVRTWTFRPFQLASAALPACSRVLLEHPGDTARAYEPLPFPAPREPLGLIVAAELLQRVSGERAIAPDDADKRRIADGDLGVITGAFWVCIDPGGKVARVEALESTGLPTFDAKIRAALGTWTYKPYAPAGQPLAVCTAVAFVYRQAD